MFGTGRTSGKRLVGFGYVAKKDVDGRPCWDGGCDSVGRLSAAQLGCGSGGTKSGSQSMLMGSDPSWSSPTGIGGLVESSLSS